MSYSVALVTWNRNISNLISKNDEARIVSRHLAESLEPAHLLAASGGQKWIDFGSGAGLPAIPLAVAGVGRSWLLVESRRPKTLFLRKTCMDINLKSVHVAHARLEDLDSDQGPFDAFTARATVRLNPTLWLAEKWVAPGGRAFLWKGSGWKSEVEGDDRWKSSWGFEQVHALSTPPIVVLVFVRKTS